MADSTEEQEYDWQPPTEAERKVIQARRERSDRVSKIMGEYMLKGYTMLGSSCANCTTILLRDRNGSNYCVSCSDLESDTGKDDPALSSTAAERQIQENHSTSPSSTESSPAPPAQSAQVETSTRSPPTPRVTSGRAAGENRRQNGARSGGRQESAHAQQPIDFSTSRTLSQITQEIEGLPGQAASTAWRHESDSPLPTVSSSLIDIGDAIDIVQRKLKWACCELDHSQSVENCTRICQLIKVCAETMEALYRLQSRS